MRILYPRADAVVCVSNGVAEDLQDVLGKRLKNIHVVYNPVDIEKIEALAKEEAVLPFKIKEGEKIIAAMGRLIPAKDYPTLLKAFSRLEANLHLMILGEGQEEKDLKKIAKELNIEKRVHFLGFQKNPYKLLARADLFVSSSTREGFPNALVEAMALGLPVISTDCPSGPQEIIENGKSGILVSVGDPAVLARAIKEIFADKAFRLKLSSETKKRAYKFSLEEGVEVYRELFSK